MFGPNVVGTAEIIRLAITTRHQAGDVSVDGGGRDDRRSGGIRRGRRHPRDQPGPCARRRLRQRLREQQVGRRGPAARGPRSVRPAGRGLPLRHDPGAQHPASGSSMCPTPSPGWCSACSRPVSRRARSTRPTPTETGSGPTIDGLPADFVAESITTLGDRPPTGFSVLRRDEPTRRRHLTRRVRRLAHRGRAPDHADRLLRRTGSGASKPR